MAIKTVPEDFVVEEQLASAYLDTVAPRVGPHALYEVQKRSLTTHELLDALSRRLDAPLSDLAAAGLKDKQALTTQHVTVRIDANRRLPPRSIESPTFTARQLGFVPKAIDAKAIACNRFRLAVRGLTPAGRAHVHEAAGRLMTEPREDHDRGAPRQVWFTNYFGNQRFGSARAGQGFIAAYLVRGEFERALQLAIACPHRKDLLRVKKFKQAVSQRWASQDWSSAGKSLPKVPERAAIEHLARKPGDFRGAFAALPYFYQQLVVEAYQSLLWNRAATTLLIDRLGESGRLWVVEDVFGQMVFPEAGVIPPDLLHADMPLLGRKTVLAAPWADAAGRVLAEEGLEVKSLRIPGLDKPWFGESPRTLFARADRFEMGGLQPDERARDGRTFKFELSFTLPRGAYATVLLRALGQ